MKVECNFCEGQEKDMGESEGKIGKYHDFLFQVNDHKTSKTRSYSICSLCMEKAILKIFGEPKF